MLCNFLLKTEVGVLIKEPEEALSEEQLEEYLQEYEEHKNRGEREYRKGNISKEDLQRYSDSRYFRPSHPEKIYRYTVEISRDVKLPGVPVFGVEVIFAGGRWEGGYLPEDIKRSITMEEGKEECEVWLEIEEEFTFLYLNREQHSLLSQLLREKPTELARREWYETIQELGEYVSSNGWKIRVGPWRGMIAS